MLSESLAGCSGSTSSSPTDAEALAAVRAAHVELSRQGHITEAVNAAHVKSCKPSDGHNALFCVLDVDGSEVHAVMWPTSNPSHPWRCFIVVAQVK